MQGILVMLPLDSKFPVKGHAITLSTLPLLTLATLEGGHFSQQLLEPGDIKVPHKNPPLQWYDDLARRLYLNYPHPSQIEELSNKDFLQKNRKLDHYVKRKGVLDLLFYEFFFHFTYTWKHTQYFTVVQN